MPAHPCRLHYFRPLFLAEYAALLVGRVKCCTQTICLSVCTSRALDLFEIGEP